MTSRMQCGSHSPAVHLDDLQGELSEETAIEWPLVYPTGPGENHATNPV